MVVYGVPKRSIQTGFYEMAKHDLIRRRCKEIPVPCCFGVVVLTAAARGLALFIGGFSLLNLFARFLSTDFDLNIWWIDFRPAPAVVSYPLITLCAVFLLAYALKPQAGVWRRQVSFGLIALILTVVAWNIANYYALLVLHCFNTTVPVPLSLFVAAGLAVTGFAVHKNVSTGYSPGEILLAAATFATCVILFPLGQIMCFGNTDYREPADAIIVFGAKAYADGTPSDALADRVRTGCQLYNSGLAGKIVFSGGPGDGGVHETEAMRQFALGLGVPDEAIVLDRGGFNTRATVRNTTEIFRNMNIGQVLAVSHFFHLPRIKMSYNHEGYDVLTVPAEESYVLTKMPYLVMREIAAFWFYYMRFLTGS